MEVGFHAEIPPALPTCYVPKGQKFFEQWVTGKTIFRGIKKYEADCIPGTPGCYRSEAKESFDKPPEVITRLCDDMYLEKRTLIGKNFAGPGVNLYSIKWRDSAFELDPNLREGTVGFIGSELSRVYPQLIVKQKGKKFYKITKQDSKKDKNLKRIYFVSFSSAWMLSNIQTMLKRLQKK
jgi:hypothetical protein